MGLVFHGTHLDRHRSREPTIGPQQLGVSLGTMLLSPAMMLARDKVAERDIRRWPKGGCECTRR